MPDAPTPNGNGGKAKLLQTLASSSDRVVQLGTLGLVAVSGVTSLFQGEKISAEGHRDRDRAVAEIHALYDRVDEFERRQKQAIENQNLLLQSNIEQVRNQTEMLENQQAMLKLVRQNQQRFLQPDITPHGN
jgi:TolA-binding protein